MRITVSVFAALGLAVATAVVADPPAQSPSAATPAPDASAPASGQKTTVVVDAAAQQAAEQQSVLEKHFLAEGYKEEMHNGEKLFCRREQPMGSRLGAAKTCGTAEQLAANEREAQAAYQRGQTQQNNPSGK
jgi:hypothetical protein